MAERSVVTGIVVVGRNEGERLIACLETLPGNVPIIYVDSGSSDGSPSTAKDMGFKVLELDPARPFSAARARNEGLGWLRAEHPAIEFVQMIDADCLVHPEWMHAAVTFLQANHQCAAAAGICREAYPERSVYNAICDLEWRFPAGEIDSCGGNAMFRVSAIAKAGGYDSDLIAGEEPDLCFRLRRSGWTIMGLSLPMVTHDAAMYRLTQWAKRTRRSGFAYAQLVGRYGRRSDRVWKRSLMTIVFWSAVLPIGAAVGCLSLAPYNPGLAAALVAMVVAAYPFQIWRIARRTDAPRLRAWAYAISLVLGKFLQFGGVIMYLYRAVTQSKQTIIEYKGAS